MGVCLMMMFFSLMCLSGLRQLAWLENFGSSGGSSKGSLETAAYKWFVTKISSKESGSAWRYLKENVPQLSAVNGLITCMFTLAVMYLFDLCWWRFTKSLPFDILSSFSLRWLLWRWSSFEWRIRGERLDQPRCQRQQAGLGFGILQPQLPTSK